jgi:hypothetical protein
VRLVIYADKLLLCITSPADRPQYSRKHRPIVERREELRQVGRLEERIADIPRTMAEGRKLGLFGFGFAQLLEPAQENLSEGSCGLGHVQDDLSATVKVVNSLFAQVANKTAAQQSLTVEEFVGAAWNLFECGQIRLIANDAGEHGLAIHYCGKDGAKEQARINRPLVAAWRASSLMAETPDASMAKIEPKQP